MNLTRTIESAENQYKQILEQYFVSVYNEKTLPSHGIDHHRRVWSYARDLLKLTPLKNTLNKSDFASELIIACYMHDIGMSVDAGIKHGRHGRILCSRFLAENNLLENDWQDVLDAIENHDKKDYKDNTGMNDLLKILSAADDLDAFGFIGIYRYAEIYLIRKIEPDKIGHLIRENARKRYDNLIRTFGSYTEVVLKQKKRYSILDNFFNNYNKQLPSYHFGTENPSGYCGVVDVFGIMIKNKIELKEIYANSDKYLTDPIIKGFFEELKKEIFRL